MKKLLLTLSVSVIYCTSIFGQDWSFYKSFPINVTPKEVDVNDAGTIFMLSQDKRIFYKTLTAPWREMPTVATGGSFNNFALRVVKNSNMVIIGDFTYGGLYITTDFGASWLPYFISTDPVSGFHETISELSNVTPDDAGIFYGGDLYLGLPTLIKYAQVEPYVEILTYDQTMNTQSAPNELYITSNGTLLIGTANAGIFITPNNGATFQQSNQSQHQILKFTENTANGRVYALGYDIANQESFLVYSDDYIDWNPINLPDTAQKANTLFYDTAGTSLWVGTNGGMYKAVTIEGSDFNWISMNLNVNASSVTDFIDDKHGGFYNFSRENAVQKLNASATAWNNAANGLKGDGDTMEFDENNKLYFGNYQTSVLSTSATSTAAWINSIIPETEELATFDIITKPGGKVFTDNKRRCFKSVDYGATFTEITPEGESLPMLKFYMGETGNLFIVPYFQPNKLLWSQDEGVTWTLLHEFTGLNPQVIDPISNISEDSNGIIYVSQLSAESSLGYYKIRYSTDHGITWNTRLINQTQFGGSGTSDIRITTQNSLTIVTIEDKWYKLDITNEFIPLTLIDRPTTLNLMAPTVNEIGELYTYNYTNGFYKSADEGVTWINIGKPNVMQENDLIWLSFNNENVPYIMVNDHNFQRSYKGIYYYNPNLAVENPSAGNLLSVTPNPAANFLTLSIPGITQVKIYDMQGKEMTTALTDDKTINIETLSEGLYLLKVTTVNGEHFNTKFVKKFN